MTPLAQLALLFGKLSLLAVGGANATVPEIARAVVNHRHWLTPAQFAQLYAIANAAPGPNVLIATIIGAHVAGIAGGIIATLAMVLPSCTLAMLVCHGFERHAQAKWPRIVKASLLPITAGLIPAAAIVLARQAGTSLLATTITCAVAVLTLRTRLHPLVLLGGAAAMGLVFL